MVQFSEIEIAGRTALQSLALTGIVLVLALLANLLVRLAVRRRRMESRQAYFVRKVVGFGVLLVAAISVILIWSPFAGELSLVLGLITAGVAFASQEAIGALFGWVHILMGGIYSVGERVEVGGVRGTVVDISPLRTQILEAGDEIGGTSWIGGRQFTGRLVSVSNKETFVSPVYNYSRWFSYIWEEFVVIVPYRDDWRLAGELMHSIVLSAVRDHIELGRQALQSLRHRFAMDDIRTEPETFLRLTEDGVELSTRYLSPLNGARRVQSEISRELLATFEDHDITIARTSRDIRVQQLEATAG